MDLPSASSWLFVMIVGTAGGAGAGCLDSRQGSASSDAADTADTAAASDATTGDADAPAPTETLSSPAPGSWMRETIGDCIHFFETLTFDEDGTSVTWSRADEDFCRGPSPTMSRTGTVTIGGDHVLRLDFVPTDWLPAHVTWTWAIMPGLPERLRTAAFRREPGSETWRREDREARGSGLQSSDQQSLVAVTLVGYPDVREMIIDFDVSQRFGDPQYPERGGSGQLTYAAERVTDASGRTAIVAEGYDADDHPDRWKFQQELMARFDNHTVDLVGAAVFPVLFELPGDASSLVMDDFDRSWERVHRLDDP